MSKHEGIINYILSLPIGSKISVRSIASDLGVSDGTAYRAIKDSESLGIVTTIARVGTVRIEKVEKKSIEALTFAEVVNIVDGTILGGKDGIYKTLNRFVIGAMTEDAMEKHIAPGNLLIVGNREEAQRLALLHDSAVLITGGFSCSEELKKIANARCLPIISSSYDTFTTASIINKAISESLIKKDIILIEDIMISDVCYLTEDSRVTDWKNLINETKHERYPVVDKDMKVVGIVTMKEMPHNVSDDELISKIMNREPITVTKKTTVAYTAHVMGWEGIDICPVVDGKKLIGIVSKQDVVKTLQYVSKQPQTGESIEDLVLKNFEFESKENKIHFSGKIVPEMLDPIGTASWSCLNMMLSTMGIMSLRQKNSISISVDSIMTYFMEPVQIDSEIDVYAEIIDMGRRSCKVEIDMFDKKRDLMAKAMISAKIFRR